MVMKWLHRVLACALALGIAGPASGAVPTAEDFEGCNAEARDAVQTGAASPQTAEPTAKDERHAARARQGDQPTDPTGTVTQSPDPQIEGMDAEGAKDPVYRAAYRTCMRKRGF
jgi:hypothetical protein